MRADELAARYAANGWPVFPVQPRGKEPLTSTGFKAATTDAAQVSKWWDTWPDANVACVPGQTGHIVIDIDGPEGEAAARALGLLSEPTLTVTTARGRHLWFKHPGGTIGNVPLADHLDVRGDAGYVLLPPSVHPTGAVYRWHGKLDEALPLPDGVRAKLGNGHRATVAQPIPERIPEGQRNATLASLAGSMRRRGSSEQAIRAALEVENGRCSPPLPADELDAIAHSVGRYSPAPMRTTTPQTTTKATGAIAGLLGPGTPTVEALLEKSGLAALPQGPTTEAVETALRELVALLEGADVLRVMAARTAAIDVLAARKVKYAGQLVSAALKLAQDEEAPPPPPPDAEPWPDPVDGGTLLTEIRALIAHYAIVPAGAAETFAIFALASHAVDAFNTAPYLFLSSPTPECGKTRVMEVVELVVRRPWRPAILTGPVLFRGIEQYEPTVFIDEAEVVRQHSDAADNVRAILHFGYRRGATVDRCVGDNHELHQFRTFGPKVFACIGDLPGTLLSRCIVIPMRRRGAGERVARFIPRDVADIGITLRRKCQRWANDHLEALRVSVPSLPGFLEDRRAEIWEPLFAVAEAAGWTAEVRRAAEDLAGVRAPETDGVELLKDIRDIFITRGVDRLATADLLGALNALEGQPWADLNRGHGITAARLAKELKPFGVASKSLRIGDETPKGYALERFADAFARYLPPPGGVPAATPPQPALALDDLAEHETQHGEACGGSESRDNGDGTGIVALLRPDGGGGRGDVRGDAWEEPAA
jgi:putative DNA primase/helicase